MTGAVKLVTAGSGAVNLQPASSVSSDVTVQVPAVDSTLVYANPSGNVGIGTSSPSAKLEVIGTIKQKYAAGNSQGYTVSISSNDDVILSNYYNAAMRFETNNTERMRIDSSGNLLVGTTTAGGTGGMTFYPMGSGSSPLLTFNKTNTAQTTVIQFIVGSTQTGSITYTNTSTAYNTSSDYRLKENIQPMQNALGVVAQLNPVTYNWKADGSDGQGFIAHELQAVVPDAVTGEKDAVDAEGKPVYQGIDTSFLVATLCKAIQELKSEVDELKAKVTV